MRNISGWVYQYICIVKNTATHLFRLLVLPTLIDIFYIRVLNLRLIILSFHFLLCLNCDTYWRSWFLRTEQLRKRKKYRKKAHTNVYTCVIYSQFCILICLYISCNFYLTAEALLHHYKVNTFEERIFHDVLKDLSPHQFPTICGISGIYPSYYSLGSSINSTGDFHREWLERYPNDKGNIWWSTANWRGHNF